VRIVELTNDDQSTKKVVFFLEAGASAEADVPDTLSPIDSFECDKSDMIQGFVSKEFRGSNPLLRIPMDNKLFM